MQDITEAQAIIIRSAKLSPPSAWIVDTTGGRIGWERVSWRKNCQRLAERGLLYANAHGDWTLTDEAEHLREKLVA